MSSRCRHGLRALLATALLLPAAAQAGDAARVPLREGLSIVSAVERPNGDEEQIATITELDDSRFTTAVEFRTLRDGALDVQTRRRIQRREDLVAGNRLNVVFQDGDPELFPAATLQHVSAATLAALKQPGHAAVVLGTVPGYGASEQHPVLASVLSGRKYLRGTLTRVPDAVTTLSVLVNGVATELPVIHAQGELSVASERVQLELWILDDADNPLILASRQDRNRGQVVRIDYPLPEPKSDALETALTQGDCRVALDGIYFDTASARLLPQSRPALLAVAQLLKQRPEWRIAIEGHTDSVGDAAANLTLSQQRAATVRDALASGSGIDAARLPASGQGEIRPVGDNATLAGRAANRRVELSRQCP